MSVENVEESQTAGHLTIITPEGQGTGTKGSVLICKTAEDFSWLRTLTYRTRSGSDRILSLPHRGSSISYLKAHIDLMLRFDLPLGGLAVWWSF